MLKINVNIHKFYNFVSHFRMCIEGHQIINTIHNSTKSIAQNFDDYNL
jgi:hypothetical protein